MLQILFNDSLAVSGHGQTCKFVGRETFDILSPFRSMFVVEDYVFGKFACVADKGVDIIGST